MWPMKFGLLLERRVSNSELATLSENGEVLSVLYSIMNPYDEINPILLMGGKQGNKLCYAKDPQQIVVSVHNDPSICILYTSFTSTIKLCKIRRTSKEVRIIILSYHAFIVANFIQIFRKMKVSEVNYLLHP